MKNIDFCIRIDNFPEKNPKRNLKRKSRFFAERSHIKENRVKLTPKSIKFLV